MISGNREINYIGSEMERVYYPIAGKINLDLGLIEERISLESRH